MPIEGGIQCGGFLNRSRKFRNYHRDGPSIQTNRHLWPHRVREIVARLKLPVVGLVALYHVDGFDDTPYDDFRAKLGHTLESHFQGWVSAGNYLRSSDIVMYQADTVIWLRLPFRVSYWRMLWWTHWRRFRMVLPS